ncbi:hypothetical protein V6N13_042485 [Hibiscus sabdariffa]|uniref:Uncharacterized protein n=1 Tax=Hibiscus sabdariffa TaxID=183260 RepID=A0ABR2G4T4_9ROSI
MGFLSLRQRYETPFIGDATSTATAVHKRGHEQRLPTTLFKTQVSSMGEEGTNMLSCRLYKTNGLGLMWEYLGKDMALLAELLEYGEGPDVSSMGEEGTNMLSCRLYKTNGLGSMWEYLGKDMALLAELLEYREGPDVGLKRDKGVVPWWYMDLRILGSGVFGSHM